MVEDVLRLCLVVSVTLGMCLHVAHPQRADQVRRSILVHHASVEAEVASRVEVGANATCID